MCLLLYGVGPIGYSVHDFFELLGYIWFPNHGRVWKYPFYDILRATPMNDLRQLEFDDLRYEVLCMSQKSFIDHFLSEASRHYV